MKEFEKIIGYEAIAKELSVKGVLTAADIKRIKDSLIDDPFYT